MAQLLKTLGMVVKTGFGAQGAGTTRSALQPRATGQTNQSTESRTMSRILPATGTIILFPKFEKVFLDLEKGCLVLGQTPNSETLEEIRAKFPDTGDDILVLSPESQIREGKGSETTSPISRKVPIS